MEDTKDIFSVSLDLVCNMDKIFIFRYEYADIVHEFKRIDRDTFIESISNRKRTIVISQEELYEKIMSLCKDFICTVVDIEGVEYIVVV